MILAHALREFNKWVGTMRNMLVIALVMGAGGAQAAPLTWTDWTTADSSSASGTLGGVSVSFTGNIDPTAQTNGGGTNFWAVNSGIFTPTGTENAPPDSDIIRLTGGGNTGTQTLTFSSAVTNPLMAIMSLGQANVLVPYDFDSPFTILNQGTGYWGGTNTSLSSGAGDVLNGYEGHGLIQFQGTFSSISWTIPTAEYWHGFQIGYVDAQQPAPVPLPAAGWLLLAGLTGLAGLRRRKS